MSSFSPTRLVTNILGVIVIILTIVVSVRASSSDQPPISSTVIVEEATSLPTEVATPSSTLEAATPTVTFTPTASATATSTALPTPDPADQLVNELTALVEETGQPGAREAIPLLARALAERNLLTQRSFAYLLATTWHESNMTFLPVEERNGRQNAIDRGYNGGAEYFGRGYCQITGAWVYAPVGQMIGINLLAEPARLLDPWTSAQSCAAYFEWRGTARYADNGDYDQARASINANDIETVGKAIAGKTEAFCQVLPPDDVLQRLFR